MTQKSHSFFDEFVTDIGKWHSWFPRAVGIFIKIQSTNQNTKSPPPPLNITKAKSLELPVLEKIKTFILKNKRLGASLARCFEQSATCHTADSGQSGFGSDPRPFAACLSPSLSAPPFLSFLHRVFEIQLKKANIFLFTSKILQREYQKQLSSLLTFVKY